MPQVRFDAAWHTKEGTPGNARGHLHPTRRGTRREEETPADSVRWRLHPVGLTTTGFKF